MHANRIHNTSLRSLFTQSKLPSAVCFLHPKVRHMYQGVLSRTGRYAVIIKSSVLLVWAETTRHAYGIVFSNYITSGRFRLSGGKQTENKKKNKEAFDLHFSRVEPLAQSSQLARAEGSVIISQERNVYIVKWKSNLLWLPRASLELIRMLKFNKCRVGR